MEKIIRKYIKEQIKALHESKKHVVKYSKSNNTYQVWLGDEIVTDFATKEKANAKAKNLNDLQNAKDVDKAQLKEAEVKGDVVNLHYKIDVYASPSDGDMSSVIDYVQNNEVVNKYGIKVEVGALESGPQEDESSVYVKFSLDRSKRGGTMTAIRLLREVVIEFIEKKIGAVVVDIEARDFKPDGPSDDEYDQMAQQSSMDDRRQQGMDPGLEEAARELGYLDEIGMFHDPVGYEKSKPHPKDQIFKKKYMGNGMYDIFKNGKKVKTIKGEGEANEWINNAKRELDEAGPFKGGNYLPGAEDIDFDVKSINMVYTDFGRFYGFNMYSEPGLKGQREKFSFRADVNDFLQSKGIKTEIPEGYDMDVLDSIVAALEKQGIEAEHNDYMDVSEAYTSEWDPETAAKNQEYIKKSKKERELKAARAAFEKAEMDGDIRGQELALAAIDLIKGKSLKEMASALGYLNEDEQLSKLLQLSKHADVRDGEEKISKLASAWDRWNYDNGDKYDDLVTHLFMAAELLGDGYRKDAQMRLRMFNKDVVKVMGGLNEEKENLKEYTVSGGQEAARNYPPTEDPGDMFAQKEVEELLPASFASRNQELKARMQAHANWAEQDGFNKTFVHAQSNTVTDGNNTYRVAMSQHYNGNYTDFKNPKFTEIRVKELDDEFDMERDLGYYVVDTTALMQDLRKLKTIKRVS